jgi:hypothetical protein
VVVVVVEEVEEEEEEEEDEEEDKVVEEKINHRHNPFGISYSSFLKMGRTALTVSFYCYHYYY